MGVIYEISNSIDDRVYIGSTLDFNRRKREHLNDLQPELIEMLKSL